MKNILPKPFKNTIIYEDNKIYACLANKPMSLGHVVVVWKDTKKDLNVLKRNEYNYLMDKVSIIRTAMQKALKVKKVYLLYMDEVRHVHWHLIPRYNIKGYDVFSAKPGKIKNFQIDDRIRKNLPTAEKHFIPHKKLKK